MRSGWALMISISKLATTAIFVGAIVTACGDSSSEVQPQLLPSVELSNVGFRSSTASAGISERPPPNPARWRKRGPAKTADPIPADESNQKSGPSDEEISHWSDADWLAHLRPIAFFDGDEYELAESDDVYLARLRSAPRMGHPSQGSAPEENDVNISSSVGERAIIGSNGADDNRSVVGVPSYYPFRAIGVTNNANIIGTTGGGNSCTMTLIGPSTAISAAHCFYNAGNGAPGTWQPAKSWAFGAARTSSGTTTFQWGSGVGAGCYLVTIPSGWVYNNTVFDDYAVIEFSNACGYYPGNAMGWFGYYDVSNTVIASNPVNVAGYPGNSYMPPNSSAWRWPTLATMGLGAGNLFVNATTSYELDYYVDVMNGQSGSALDQPMGGYSSHYVTGIVKGNPVSSVPPYNWGRRLDSTVTAFIGANSAL